VKVVSCREGRLEVAEVPPPVPARGQLLIEVLRCGICGSDLHAREHCDEMAELACEAGYDDFMRSDRDVVMGHEFCGAVLEHGTGSRKRVPAGSTIVALPLLRAGHAVHAIGLSPSAPGAYAEQMLVEESLSVPVPNGLPAQVATLTEPMAVAWHAVRRGEVKKRTVAVVIGCGPIGLSVICMLKAIGVRTVIASDFSGGRRALASRCGADVVVDPAADSPFASAAEHGHLTSLPAALDTALGAMEKLQRIPLPWHRVWRAAEALGATTPKSPVVFECVGVPGVIDQLIASAPLFSRVVVVGVCMGADQIRPAMAINKEIDLRFVVGYTPIEFRDTLHMLAEGKVNAAPLVTGSVGLEGVADAFTTLGDPEAHAKILVDPSSRAVAP
jgi:threonine dehydrogenase-like Zn-dependent dehydrogenase